MEWDEMAVSSSIKALSYFFNIWKNVHVLSVKTKYFKSEKTTKKEDYISARKETSKFNYFPNSKTLHLEGTFGNQKSEVVLN